MDRICAGDSTHRKTTKLLAEDSLPTERIDVAKAIMICGLRWYLQMNRNVSTVKNIESQPHSSLATAAKQRHAPYPEFE